MKQDRILWALQVLLAVLFAIVGVLKTTLPMKTLLSMFPWTDSAPALFVRFLGVTELAAAIGLILPMATGILPRLTGFTAFALTLVMLLAVGLHSVRGEWFIVPVPLVVGALTAFVAVGRTRRATSGGTELC
jgi:putative oxidoreductase